MQNLEVNAYEVDLPAHMAMSNTFNVQHLSAYHDPRVAKNTGGQVFLKKGSLMQEHQTTISHCNFGTGEQQLNNSQYKL